MASKKKSKDGVNRSALIRRYPDLKPAEVVDKIKKEHGVEVTPALIYNIRAVEKKAAGPTGKVSEIGRIARASTGGASLDAVVRQIVREEIRAFFAEK